METLQDDKTRSGLSEAEKEEVKGEAMQLIVFKQGEEEYAINIDQIKEVVITPNITKMPQTPEYVKGVSNIRGNIIAVLDLEKKFGLKPTIDLSSKNFTLVIESDEYKIGVLVKEVPNTLSVLDTDIEESVNVIHDSAMEQNYIKGIVKRDNRLIILIDTFKVLGEADINTVSQIVS